MDVIEPVKPRNILFHNSHRKKPRERRLADPDAFFERKCLDNRVPGFAGEVHDVLDSQELAIGETFAKAVEVIAVCEFFLRHDLTFFLMFGCFS